MKAYLIGFCLLFTQLECTKSRDQERDSVPAAAVPKTEGTFIQYNLVRNWTDARWQQEFNALREAGMQYIILGSTLNTDTSGRMYAIFPTTIPNVTNRYGNDIVENCLRNAAAARFKVFLGLNFDERWWRGNHSIESLTPLMQLGNQLAEELVNRYKSRYAETMYGWYWVWEVDNLHFTTLQTQEALAKALNTNLDHLSRISPDMPMMLCPFFNYRLGTPQQNADMWRNVFRQTNFRPGDIFAPQDCIGAGGLNMEVLSDWFAALKPAVDSKAGLEFWVDTETFDQRFWTSATMDRFVKQMEHIAPYVKRYVNFAYSHYYSPWKDNPAFHDAYVYYTKHGKLPDMNVSADIQHADVNSLTDLSKELTWSVRPSSEVNVAGYFIYLNDSLYLDWQYKPGVDKSRRLKIAGSALKDRNVILIRPYSVTGKQGAGRSVAFDR